MIEIKERQTAVFLKTKILEVLQSYGVSVEQIFSVTCDNGANMLAAVKGLKKEFDFLVSQQLENDAHPDDADTETQTGENDIETAENNEESELSDALSTEFIQDQLNLVRCSVHTLQLAVLDVVDKKDECIKEITGVAKKCKGVKYKTHFDYHNATFPPVWGQTRWGGIYMMMDCFRRQKDFFLQLAVQFPELGKFGYKSNKSFVVPIRATFVLAM